MCTFLLRGWLFGAPQSPAFYNHISVLNFQRPTAQLSHAFGRPVKRSARLRCLRGFEMVADGRHIWPRQYIFILMFYYYIRLVRTPLHPHQVG